MANSIHDFSYTEYNKTQGREEALQRELSLSICVDSHAEYERILREIRRIVYGPATAQAEPNKQLSLPITTAEQLIGREPSEEGKQVLAAVTAAVEAAPPSEPHAPWEPEESEATKTVVTTVAALEKTKAAIDAVLATPELSKAPDAEVVLVSASAVPAAPEPPAEPDDAAIAAFDAACDTVHNVDDAVRVWFEQAASIKKLSEPSKRRCSTTLSLRLSNQIGVEPMEAQELIKAGVVKAQLAKKHVQTKPAPDPVTKPASDTSGVQEDFLRRLAADKQPSLGIAVKIACQVLAKNGEVSYVDVEQLLCESVGKHPAIESVDAVLKITQTSKMKLYAGAAKVKLV